jgi:putative membrane protein
LDEKKENGVQYAQQHLANERTYLAWVRTSITIIGIGFLAAGLVFRTSPYDRIAHIFASISGIVSLVFGFLIIAFATMDYVKKREDINNSMFRPTVFLIRFVFLCMAIISCSSAIMLYIMLFL